MGGDFGVKFTHRPQATFAREDVGGFAGVQARVSTERSWVQLRRRGAGFVGNIYMQAIEQGLSVAMPPRLVVRRRIHEANQGLQRVAQARSEYLRVLKASLDRRKARA